jgi:hypothetical protein
LRSLGVKGTFKSNTEKTLAFLVESGALYLCIWVHSNPLTVLHKSFIFSHWQIAYLSTSVVTATPGMDFFGAVTVQLAVRPPLFHAF